MKTGFVLATLAAILLLGLTQQASANCGSCATHKATVSQQAAVGAPTDMTTGCGVTPDGTPGTCSTGMCGPQANMNPTMPGPDNYGVLPDEHAVHTEIVTEPVVAPEEIADSELEPSPQPVLLTCGVTPFSEPMQYMSQAGYLRWQHFQQTGAWETPGQAMAAARTERMLCAVR